MITQEGAPMKMLEELARSHLCGECGGNILVAWGGDYGVEDYVLRCGNDISHTTITRHDKKREEQIQRIKEALHEPY